MSDRNDIARARQRQRLAAAQSSAEKRGQRKIIRAKIKEGVIDAVELLRGDLEQLEPFIGGWTVEGALKALKGTGVGDASRADILAAWRPRSTMARLRDLSPADRADLAGLVEQIHDPWTGVA